MMRINQSLFLLMVLNSYSIEVLVNREDAGGGSGTLKLSKMSDLTCNEGSFHDFNI